MKKNCVKGNCEEKMSKERQNELALENAVKMEDHIYYDEKSPLVINEQCKVIEIYEKKDEEENEETTSFNRYMPREVVLVFTDKVSDSGDAGKVPYIMTLYTELTLEELEEKLMQCNDEQDIENIQD